MTERSSSPPTRWSNPATVSSSPTAGGPLPCGRGTGAATKDTVVWRFEVETDADELRWAMEEGVAVRVGFTNGNESGLWGFAA